MPVISSELKILYLVRMFLQKFGSKIGKKYVYSEGYNFMCQKN